MKHFILFLMCISLMAFAGEPKPPVIGDTVPGFTLKGYDGKDVELNKLVKENKFTVLVFISTECPVSNAYNERMEKLHETFSKKGVAVVGVNANKEEDVQRIAAHAKEKGFKFTILKDLQNKIADLYGAQVTPETFVIGPAGKLMYHGRIDDSRNPDKVRSHDLADALDKLLAGKELALAQTKAFGCSIKRVGAD